MREKYDFIQTDFYNFEIFFQQHEKIYAVLQQKSKFCRIIR